MRWLLKTNSISLTDRASKLKICSEFLIAEWHAQALTLA